MVGYLLIFGLTAVFCMVGRRLSTTVITAPMVFLALGAGAVQSGVLPDDGIEMLLHPVTEVALVVLLFLDAAQIDMRALRRRHEWPLRMLLIGLPLTIALGTAVAFFLLPGWPIFAVALVAAILAPTDAALGQAVITNPAVPERPRRALTVESGVNDGLALPTVLLFASLTAEFSAQSGGDWLAFAAMQILLGPLAGLAVGLAGGLILLQAKSRRLTSETYEGIGALALAGTAYLSAVVIGGNGFIAAFVAGLGFGSVVRGKCRFVYDFTESEGQLLSWAAFLLLGGALIPQAVADLTWPVLALILISLFVVRPLAIWISLIGSEAAPLTRLFFGWFGPRGLATALFALLVVDVLPPELGEQVLHLAVNTVWISAVLHGITAAPGARWYGARIARMAPCAETKDIESFAKPLITKPFRRRLTG